MRASGRDTLRRSPCLLLVVVAVVSVSVVLVLLRLLLNCCGNSGYLYFDVKFNCRCAF